MKKETAVHTSGPWTTDRMAQTVRAENDQMTVCDIRGWGFLTGEGGLHLSDDYAIEVQRANARLIATAPALLAALRDIQSQCAGHSDEFSQRVWVIADMAIQSATGA